MRIGCLIVAAIAFLGHFTSANEWREDPRCPGYGDAGKRALGTSTIEDNMRLLEDSLAETGKRINDSDAKVKSKKNLRGIDRQLDDIFNFQIKMYWEEGYCWQEEWDEREWCFECEGSSCGEDDHLWLQKCDDNEDEQRFTYEIVDATTQAVKIKPLERQDLCWTRVAVNEHQLQPCGGGFMDEITGLDKQILLGFAESGRFELNPNGFDETNPDMFKCMTTQHHPKSKEFVKADFCSLARKNHASRWIVHNPEGSSQAASSAAASPTESPTREATASPTETNPRTDEKTASPTVSPIMPTTEKTASPTKVSAGEDETSPPGEGATPAPTPTSDGLVGILPEVKAMSGSYCTPATPCAQCFGDCDTDDDCQGKLVCYQRDGGHTVPSCSGGENSHSDTDYCIDPAV